MYTGRLSRRAALRFGVASIVSGLVIAAGQSVYAQGAQPAPAQVPRTPAPAGPSASAGPQGNWRWLRTEYGDGSTVTAPDPTRYTITLQADGALALQADCNRGSGRYAVTGPQITLQVGPITLAACPPGTQDSRFLRDLRDVVTYVMDGENLVLNMKVDTGNMVFGPQPPASLTGAAWRVLGVNNGRGGVASVLTGTELTATFGDDGTVSGETGCNAFRGQYTLKGASITFGPLISTKRACLSEQVGTQEQSFLAALAQTARYELVGDRLALRNADGATQVTLSR